MKSITYGIHTALILALLSGCASKKILFSQNTICTSPLAQIHLQSIYQKPSQSTLDAKEFKALLSEVLSQTGCIDLVGSATDESYILNATYEVSLKHEEQKETLYTKLQNVLLAKVILNLNHQDLIRRDFGESKILIEENKFLGIGEGEKFSKDDEKKALQSSALVAIKNFISSLQKSQEQGEIEAPLP